MKLPARSTLALIFAASVVLTAPMHALALPTVIGAGEAMIFNFDATALGPFAKVFLVTGFAEIGAAQSGDMWLYGGLNGGGTSAGSCQAFFDVSDCLPFIEGADWAYENYVADGDFSLFVSSDQGAYSVDPYAKAYLSANDTSFIRIDSTRQVVLPEPSSLALLGAAAVGALTGRRRKA